MIMAVTGQPGSGKSYYAVRYLTQFFDRDGDLYVPKSNYTIVSNVEGLKLPHDVFTPELLSVKIWEKLYTERRRKTILVIDECQHWLKRPTPEQQYFFEWHRHLGVEIVLMCHSLIVLSKTIQVLIEKEVRSAPQLLHIFGRFRYSHWSGDSRISIFMMKIRKDIFALYKSFEQLNTHNKTVSPLYIFMLVFVFLICIFWFGSKLFADSLVSKKTILKSQSQSVQSIQSSIPRSRVRSRFFPLQKSLDLDLKQNSYPDLPIRYHVQDIKTGYDYRVYLDGSTYRNGQKIERTELEGVTYNGTISSVDKSALRPVGASPAQSRLSGTGRLDTFRD